MLPTDEELARPLATEVIRLRAELAALTDPSPEAQLRRYREAVQTVKDPPRVLLPWEKSNEWMIRRDVLGSPFVFAGTQGGGRYSIGFAHFPMAGTIDEIMAAADVGATECGWQLCNGAP